ncbi:hypothetical protein ACFFK0_08000 [Paenibacillus chartarius]|uniref:DUF4829 domain-containing protein n=1 Tax=Paenibacillus chartarius TaxID=747481 RepID=A0ABV6DIE7_9BACL
MKIKVYSISSVLIVVTIVAIFWVKSMDNKYIVPVIEGFYGTFIDQDYTNMYKYTDFSKYAQDPVLTNEGKAGLAHSLLNDDRHWYGEIKRYDLRNIHWRGINKRRAEVAVIALDGYGTEQTYADKVTIEKRETGWLITEYDSGSPWRTMKMP